MHWLLSITLECWNCWKLSPFPGPFCFAFMFKIPSKGLCPQKTIISRWCLLSFDSHVLQTPIQTCAHSKNAIYPLQKASGPFSFLLTSNRSNTAHSNYKITSLQSHHLNWSHQHLLRRRQWHPTPVLLPGKSHGRRSLEACSPWGRWGSDVTERLHFNFSLSCIVEGSGNPLQCSCLENPRDRGAWWAAIYGVAQSQTRLKWLSSSSKH